MSTHETDQRVQWRIEIVISIIAIIISVASLLFTLFYNLALGAVQVYPPSGYAIIRQLDWFQSDHLVFPFEWQHDGGRPVVIRHPEILLRELNSQDEETEKAIKFYLGGEFVGIGSIPFSEGYDVKRSFIISPHSISLKVLVFHVEDWWDDKNEEAFKFRFTSGQRFNMYLSYQRGVGDRIEIPLGRLPIYGSVDTLNSERDKGHWWDYWTLEN